MDGENMLLMIFGGVFVLASFMFVFGATLTGYATETSTSSEVVISQYFAIEMSTNLASGIAFGTQESTAATNINGTSNHDGTSSATTYFMNVSADSNTNVNFSIRADGGLNTSAGDLIGIGNESYFYSSTTDAANPIIGSEVSLTTSYVAAGGNVAPSENMYYRFWLDIPAATPTGTYNNTISFQGASS